MDNFTNKLTEEELTALLKEPAQSKKSTEIEDFLLYYGLEPGSHLISCKLIYAIYEKWSVNPLVSKAFKNKASLYIAPVKKEYYLVNQDALKISKYLYNSLNIIKQKTINYRPHFNNFLNFYGLKPGTFWLEVEVFHYLYDLWTFNKKKPLQNKQITELCSLVFTKKQNNKQKTFFGVDHMILNHISEQQIQEIKEGVLFKNDKKKKRPGKATKA